MDHRARPGTAAPATSIAPPVQHVRAIEQRDLRSQCMGIGAYMRYYRIH